MKKTLTTIAIAAAALGMSETIHAQATVTFNSFPSSINVWFTDSEGTTLSSYGGGNYVAAYWYSAVEIPETFTADWSWDLVTAIGIGDLSSDGKAYLTTAPDYFPLTTPAGQTGYLGMTIFKLGEDLSFLNTNDFDAWAAGYMGNQAGIRELLESMAADGEVGHWATSYMALDGGSAGGNAFSNFMSGNGGPFSQNTGYATSAANTDAIPEPSTWLLLGAGAAFVLVMRRRKNSQ